tara:strand:- start:54509 stop:57523 length:3015 start_codon:yes stop_codon:yes gene_type:complete
MKSFKLILLALLAFAFSSESYTQMVGTNCFLMGDNIEMGINPDGYPGTTTGSIPAPFPTHWSGGPSRLCYVANPDGSDPWADYDGGFYMPGSPENRFGIEIDGVTTWNSSAVGSSITSYGLSNYAINGNCRSVDWTGSRAGIDIKITYIIDVTKAYYRMLVVLENTNPIPKSNVYFYYSADPDNNQFIGWGFGTTNTVVAQPTPFCPKALVTATQSAAWDNYLGYGGIGDDIRVARGSFFVTDASDVYDGAGPMIGTVGSTAFADQAIAICHRDATLGIGGISEFEFIVIMSEEELEEALLAQYYLDYDGADPYALCTDSVVVDTLYSPCAGTTTLEMTGPNLDAYTWTWTNAETGEVVGTGPVIEVTPAGTTHYIVTGEPVGDCFISDIVREVVVVAVGIGPSMVIDPIGPQCGAFDVTELVITDLNDIPGTFITFYTEAPDSIDDPTDILVGDIIYPGDDIWVLMGDPAPGGCYHIVVLEIEFIEITAGLDSLGFEMCNEAGEIILLNTFIVDSALLAGDLLEEVGPPSGGFDPVTTEFDPAGLPGGTYEFRYIALGGVLCENDTATYDINVYNQGTAGDDNTATACNEIGFTVDVNLLLSGHDIGGTFSEVTPTGGAFDPLTGIFTVDGGITPGDYVFEYLVTSVAPCVDDISTFTVTVTVIPTVSAGPDQSICIGDETVLAGAGTPATYVWDPATVIDGVPFTPGVGTITYTVTATDLFGCVNTDDADIVVHPLPVISFVASEIQGCTPFETEFTITSDVDIATTDWFFGDGDIATGVVLPNITHTYLFGGLYDVRATVTDIYGCASSVEYTEYITVEDQPIAAFTMSPQSVFISNTMVEFTNESLYASDFIWDFGDGSPFSSEVDPIHFFPNDIGDVYYPVQLTASNYLGCLDSVTMYMNVKGIIIFYIPNTFTPDGDQFNQTFLPVFESGFDPYDFHMVVYNRWGEVVFESFDATAGWNGAYGSGGLVDDGVYTWAIDFKELHTDKRHEHRGHVTMLK